MPDFNVLPDPEWSEVLSRRNSERSSRVLLVPQFDFERDNDARAAWRLGDAEPERLPRLNGVIIRKFHDLPPNFDPQAQMPDSTLSKGRWSLTPLVPELEEIGIATDSHLVYQPNRGTRGQKIEIWWRGEQLHHVRKRLNEWIGANDPQFSRPKRSRWAKIYSLSPHTKAEIAKKLQDDEIRQAFRRQPDQGYTPVAIGFFEWPADTVKAPDVLGKSFEALDPIRMDHHCYIKWVAEQSLFQIMGKRQENVEKATERVRATLFQVVARQLDPKPNYFIRPVSMAALTQNPTIDLVKFDSPEADGSSKMTPELKLRAATKLVPLEEDDTKSKTSTLRLQKSISRALEKLTYYAGNLTMRVRLGQFVLTRYRPETRYTLEDFEQLLAEGSRGFVPPENGDRMKWKRQRKLFKRLAESPEILQPIIDSTVLGADENGRPYPKRSVSAVFVVQLHRELGYFRVEVRFNRLSGGTLERTSTKICKIEQEDGQLMKVSDISLIDLERRASAWSFEVNAGHPVDLTRFPLLDQWVSENIKLWNDSYVAPPDAKGEFKPEHRYISYTPMRGISVLSILQQSIQQYAVPKTSFLCEISLNEDFINRANNRAHPTAEDYKPNRRWISLSLFHHVWDAQLAENASIGVGERVKWDAGLGNFFPMPPDSKWNPGAVHPGFGEFVSALDQIQDLIYPLRGALD